MSRHIAIIGAGAVGGYVGGHLARAGLNVSLVDAWPEHVEAMRGRGLLSGGTQGEDTVRVNALHVTEVQRFCRKPVEQLDEFLAREITKWTQLARTVGLTAN